MIGIGSMGLARSSLSTFDSFVPDLARGVEGFVESHPAPFLLFQSTESVLAPQASVTPSTRSSAAGVLCCRLAAEIVGSRHVDGAGGIVISLGRSSTCGIRIEAPSLSKVHARLFVSAAHRVALADAGSRNGTRVNGRALVAGEPVLLADGDELLFGSAVAATFLSARRFAQVVEWSFRSFPAGAGPRESPGPPGPPGAGPRESPGPPEAP